MLENKVAVVTGGTRGIGKAVCLALAMSGAKIAFIYAGSDSAAQESLSAIRSLGGDAECYKCDVSDYTATQAIFKEITERFGTVDILVNNAGITKDKLLLSMKPEEFSSVIDVNLVGAYNMIKQVYPIMMRKKSGKIINISSVAGITGNAGQTNYAASKAGLIGLTKSVAKELASRGVCCNAIAPGFVSTDMTAIFEEKPEVVAAVPMKRFAAPEEVAQLVLFLASNNSDYITGEVIRIDGGLAM